MKIDVLDELLLKASDQSGLRILRRQESPDHWLETLSTSSRFPVEATNASLDYQLAYFSERDANTRDFSFVLTDGDIPVALIFGQAVTDEAGNRIVVGSPQRPIQIAFVETDPSNGVQSKVQTFLASGLLNMSVSNCFLQRPATSPLCSLDSFLVQSLACVAPRIEYVVNPVQTVNLAFSNIRRSYKSTIRSPKARELEVSVLRSDTAHKFHEFKDLHREVSGRITRGERTWLMQLEALKSGDAFIVEVRREGTLVGGSFISTSRDEALYGVGAYSRPLMKDGFPIGHVAQVEVIRHLARLGISRYLIGVQRDNLNIHDSKLKGIDAFKRGFGAGLEISLLFSSDTGSHY